MKRKKKQSAGRRLTLITVDQVISGASNVLIAILAARLLKPAQFGFFGIMFLVYMILVGVSRALISDVVLVHPEESRERPGEAIGSALVVAAPLAIGLAAVGLGVRTVNPGLGDAALVLAACLPLLVLQDVGRYLGFATRRAARAVVLDSVWLVVMVALVGVLATRHGRTLASLVAAWGGAGAAAGALVFVWCDIRQVQLGLAWIKRTWTLGWRYLITYFSLQGSALVMSSEIGGIAGARSLGGVQGTLVLVRPFNTFQLAMLTAGIGEVAHAKGDRGQIWRRALLITGLTATAAAINAAVLLVLPTRIGETLLGQSWHVTKPLLLPTGVMLVMLGLFTGPMSALLGVKAMQKAMSLSVATAIIQVTAAGAGAAVDGAKGALWAVAGGMGLVTLACWITFAAHFRDITPTSVDTTGPRTLGLAGVLEQAVGLSPLPASIARGAPQV